YDNISEKGVFPRLLGEIKGFDKKIEKFKKKIKDFKIESESRLVYDKLLNKFYLKFPVYIEKKKIEDRQKIVAIDPGEKIFSTFYGTTSYGHIGEDMRKSYSKFEGKIRKLQSILSK